MFLKPVHVKKAGKRRTYWKLVESYRTARGPRHRTVAYIGELGASQRSGWARLGRSLTVQPEPAYPFFAQLESQDPVPQTVEVQVRGVRIQRPREFGSVCLGLVLWRALGFDDLFSRLLPTGREEVPWGMVVAILTISRLCNPSSGLHVAETWYRSTALADLAGGGPRCGGEGSALPGPRPNPAPKNSDRIPSQGAVHHAVRRQIRPVAV